MHKSLPPKDVEQRFLTAYDDYADAIFRYITLRLGDRELGKELMQETFLHAWEAILRGVAVREFRPFLYRIANNLLIDTARRKKRRREESLETLQEQGFDVESPREDHASHLDGQRVIEVLQQVEEPLRTVVILRYVEGLTPKEIATLLDVSPNVISVRIHRGLQKVRSLLPSSYG